MKVWHQSVLVILSFSWLIFFVGILTLSEINFREAARTGFQIVTEEGLLYSMNLFLYGLLSSVVVSTVSFIILIWRS